MSRSDYLFLSTAMLPERDRLAIWREVYGRLLFNVEINPIEGSPFEARTELRRLPSVGLSSGWRTPAHFRVTRPLLATASDNVVLAVVTRGRAEASQFGRDLEIPQGGAVLMTTCDVGRHTLLDRGRHLSVQLPRQALAPFLPDIEDRLLRPIRPDSSALKLLRGYVLGAMAMGEGASAQMQQMAAQHLRDLIALICGVPEDEVAAQGDGPRAARLEAARQAIKARLDNGDLSAESVGALQQVSADYIRKLFRESGTSFHDYVLELRLAQAHAGLADPLRAHESIARIALASGFADISYFNRCFRRRYGLTPSELRKARLSGE